MRYFLLALFTLTTLSLSAQDLDSIFKNLELKEVVVKSKKIRHSGDTISYNASTYLSKNDKVLEDLLKKMPGISISPDGQISYNGKWITEFYIEGTDMLGGRYNIATTNINAEDVAAVQVMEHHQDAKVLQGTQRGDNPAINIKLKNIAKGVWASTLDAEVGTPTLARRATINLMNFKPKRQNISFYKTNNVGTDLRRDINAPADMNSDTGTGLLQPSRPSIGDTYSYRNDTHNLSVNQLHKIDEDHLLTYNINYLFDKERRNSAERSDYFITADSTLTILEENSTQSKMNYLNGNLNYKINSRKFYLKEALSVSAAFNCEHGLINTDIARHLNNHSLEISNRITAHRNLSNGSVADYSSAITYTDKDARLTLPTLQQDIHICQFDTDNSLSLYSRRIPYLMYSVNGTVAMQYQHVTTGITQQDNRIDMVEPSAHIVPKLLFHNGERLQLLVYVPIGIRYYHINDKNQGGYGKACFSVKPYANFSYKPNSHFDYNLLASYEESLPSAMQQLTAIYYQNYRTTYANTCLLEAGLQKTFKTSASVSYKDVIRMLFANVSLTYVNTHSQHSTAYRFVNDVTDYYLLPIGTDNRIYQADQSFSKGFFKFNSKIQESLTIGRSNGEYLIDDVQHNSRTDYLKASVSYNASFAKWLSLMTNNTLSISQPYTDGIKGTDLYRTFTNATSVILWAGTSLSFNTQIQYYYSSYFTQGRSSLFLNERIEYHLKSTIFSLECINLFDRKTYNRIIDNGVTRYVSQYQLRGRTVMAGIRIKLL